MYSVFITGNIGSHCKTSTYIHVCSTVDWIECITILAAKGVWVCGVCVWRAEEHMVEILESILWWSTQVDNLQVVEIRLSRQGLDLIVYGMKYSVYNRKLQRFCVICV